ncbi:unnamed protein product [Amoebophrya sp. A120]|nr:unnamed protein product [Amoebophrya sp. A120]|eukprot:GSA120T00004405001.1
MSEAEVGRMLQSAALASGNIGGVSQMNGAGRPGHALDHGSKDELQAKKVVEEKIAFVGRHLRDPYAESIHDLSHFLITLQCVCENPGVELEDMAWEVGLPEVQMVCVLQRAREDIATFPSYFQNGLRAWTCLDRVAVRTQELPSAEQNAACAHDNKQRAAGPVQVRLLRDLDANWKKGQVGTLLGAAVEPWDQEQVKRSHDQGRSMQNRVMEDRGRRCVVDFSSTASTKTTNASAVDAVQYVAFDDVELTPECKKVLRPDPQALLPSSFSTDKKEENVKEIEQNSMSSYSGGNDTERRKNENSSAMENVRVNDIKVPAVVERASVPVSLPPAVTEVADPEFHKFYAVWATSGNELLTLKQLAAETGISVGKAQRLLRKAKEIGTGQEQDKAPDNSQKHDKDNTIGGRSNCSSWPYNVPTTDLVAYEEIVRVDAMHQAAVNARFVIAEPSRSLERKKLTAKELAGAKACNASSEETHRTIVKLPAHDKTQEVISTNPHGTQNQLLTEDIAKKNKGVMMGMEQGVALTKRTLKEMARDKEKTKREAKKSEGVTKSNDPGNVPGRTEHLEFFRVTKESFEVIAVFGPLKELMMCPAFSREEKDRMFPLLNDCARQEHTVFDTFYFSRLATQKHIRMTLKKPLRILCTSRIPDSFANFRRYLEAGGTFERESDIAAAEGGFLTAEAYWISKAPQGYDVRQMTSVNAKGQTVTNWTFVRNDAAALAQLRALGSDGQKMVMEAMRANTPNGGDFMQANIDIGEWRNKFAQAKQGLQEVESATDMSRSVPFEQDSGILQQVQAELAISDEVKATAEQKSDGRDTVRARRLRAEKLDEKEAELRDADEKRRKGKEAVAYDIKLNDDGTSFMVPQGVSMANVKLDKIDDRDFDSETSSSDSPEKTEKRREAFRNKFSNKSKQVHDAAAPHFRDFRDEKIEISYSLPEGAQTSPTDFWLEQCFWKCIEDQKDDLSQTDLATGLLLATSLDEETGTVSDERARLMMQEEPGVVQTSDEAFSSLVAWLRNPKILAEQKRRAESIAREWQEQTQKTAANVDAKSKNFKPKKRVPAADELQDSDFFLSSPRDAQTKDASKTSQLLLPASGSIAVHKFWRKRMKFRHVVRGVNEMRKKGLLDVEQKSAAASANGGSSCLSIHTTIKGSHYVIHGPGGTATIIRDHKGTIEKSGDDVMRMLKHIAYVTGGGGSGAVAAGNEGSVEKAGTT